MADKKYYWLKLKRDFFKRHDIRIIEEMPNGKDYILFYLKLLLESIDHEGNLRFSDAIPYNEQMLSVVTNTNVDIVKAAMDLFISLGMIEVFDDQTIYMNEVEKLIGSETASAERKRLSRNNQKTLAECDNVTTMSHECHKVSQNCHTEKEKEQEKYKELYIESDVVVPDTDNDSDDEDENVDNSVENSKLEALGGTLGKGVVFLSEEQSDALLEKLGLDVFNFYVEKLATFIIEKKAKVSSHYSTILKWAREDARI